MNTPSDNGGMPRKHPLAVGTREHGAYSARCVAAADFPADAVSRADTGSLHGTKPVCITISNAAHEG